jgi:tetratricopeptide (TPR) repeat protein
MAQWLSIGLRLALVLALLYGVLLRRPWRKGVWEVALRLGRRLRLAGLRRASLGALATHEMIARNFKTAIDLSREVIRLDLASLDPALPDDLLRVAQVFSRFGQPESAVLWLAQVDGCTIDAHRRKPTVLLMLTYNLVALNRYAEAEVAFQRISMLKVPWDHWLQRMKLRSAKTRWDVAMAGGYVAFAAERWDEALARYRAAQTFAAKLPVDKQLATLANLAATETEAGNLEIAERHVTVAKDLAGEESWPGRVNFLWTIAKLRLAQGRRAEARAAVNEVLSLGVRDFHTLHLAAAVAVAEGSGNEALTYLDQLGASLRNRRYRREVAATLDQIAELDQLTNRGTAVDELRRRAATLRSESPPPPPGPEDPLHEQIRSNLLGRKFGPVEGRDALILGVWLAFFLFLAASVLFPWTLPRSFVFAQGLLLLLFAVASRPFGRWLMRPRLGPELSG